MADKPENSGTRKKEIPTLGLEEDNAQIEAMIDRRLAETEQARHEEARSLAEQFTKRALEKMAKQDGGGSGTQSVVTTNLLRNVDDQFVSLADDIQCNFNEWYGDRECEDEEMSGSQISERLLPRRTAADIMQFRIRSWSQALLNVGRENRAGNYQKMGS